MLILRSMTSRDLDFAAACTDAEGWVTETREEFEGFLAHDPAGCLVAEWDGRPAGICVATSYGRHGFVGELIVTPEHRSFGIGPRLLGEAVTWLRSRGCDWISLDGVRRAAPFYQSFGFETVCRSLRLRGRPKAERRPNVRPMRRDDLAAVFAVDQRAFGADRSFFLKRRFDRYPELSKLMSEGGEVTGFIFGRRRSDFVWAGPWWARADAIGAGGLLLDLAGDAFGLEIRLGVLDAQPRSMALVRDLGFSEMPSWPFRMTLGRPPTTVGLEAELIAIGSAAKG